MAENDPIQNEAEPEQPEVTELDDESLEEVSGGAGSFADEEAAANGNCWGC